MEHHVNGRQGESRYIQDYEISELSRRLVPEDADVIGVLQRILRDPIGLPLGLEIIMDDTRRSGRDRLHEYASWLANLVEFIDNHEA